MRIIRLSAITAAITIAVLTPGLAQAAPITPVVPPRSPSAATTTCSRRTSRTSPVWPSTRCNPCPGRRRERQHRPGGVQRRRRPDLPVHPGRRRLGVQFSTDGGAPGPSRRTRASRPGSRRAAWAARRRTGHAAARRHRLRPDPAGPIGTLPATSRHGLVSNGDPELAFGPVPGAERHLLLGQRPAPVLRQHRHPVPRSRSRFAGDAAIAVSRTDDVAGAIAGQQRAWMAPVIVTKQNSALFSDKEQIWADNAESSPHFGNVYVCNVGFRGTAGSEPVLFARSTDGGDTWRTRQLTRGHQQRADRRPAGLRDPHRQRGRGLRGLGRHGHPDPRRRVLPGPLVQRRRELRAAAGDRRRVAGIGQFDPAQGRFTIDGIAGARTNIFPSIDIANGAPSGADATDQIARHLVRRPRRDQQGAGVRHHARPTAAAPTRARWPSATAATGPTSRPSRSRPDGTDAWLVYNAWLDPWRSDTTSPRRVLGVVRHADVSAATGAIRAGPPCIAARSVTAARPAPTA